MTLPGALDWQSQLVSVTDGDTVRLHLERVMPGVNGWEVVIRSANERGVPIRLVILDTPERGSVDYARARADLAEWCTLAAGRLRVETYESAGWDRLLGDLYVEGDRGDTATQWMLRRGWEPYVRGVDRH